MKWILRNRRIARAHLWCRQRMVSWRAFCKTVQSLRIYWRAAVEDVAKHQELVALILAPVLVPLLFVLRIYQGYTTHRMIGMLDLSVRMGKELAEMATRTNAEAKELREKAKGAA